MITTDSGDGAIFSIRGPKNGFQKFSLFEFTPGLYTNKTKCGVDRVNRKIIIILEIG